MKTMKHELGFNVRPLELKIEITRACNLECSFCYLGDPQLWRKEEHMPGKEVLAWIDWTQDNGIPGVRFTGGEAILHPKNRDVLQLRPSQEPLYHPEHQRHG